MTGFKHSSCPIRPPISDWPRQRFMAVGVCAYLAVFSWSCRPDPASQRAVDEQTDQTTVFVSILPQAYFVERVGGEYVDVQVLVGPGQSPATYEPTSRQMKTLARAQAFFRIGVPIETSLIPKIRGTFQQIEIIDTREGITLRRMTDEISEHPAHTENDHGHDHAEGDDPHIWMSPRLVKIQARTICAALCRIDPAHSNDFEQNLALFHADLDTLDAHLATVLAPLKGKELFVFHPAYGYFTEAYGLKQIPVEIEGKEPSAKDLAALIKKAREAEVRVIFVQPQFSTRSAEAIAGQIGGVVVPFDPLARDYIKNLEACAEQVRQALLE